jgi:ABC-2 type transport system ATP-binding protein
MAGEAIIVQELVKQYPKVRAVDGISFTINEAEIFGLLGPNGAGKTTTIRILLTLINPTGGKISVFGIDVLIYPHKVRQISGYVPQDIALDGELTGYENILMYSKLYGLVGKERSQRIDEVLEYMEMKDRASEMANTYSGGMMRRFELAQALVNRPRILFLDEPSIGLDPRAKRVIWGLIRKLRDEFNTTILITTHDMNEADAVCDRIGIMDKGRLAAIDKPVRLKATIGGDVITMNSGSADCPVKLKELGYTTISESPDGNIDLIVSDGEKQIPLILEALKARGVTVETVSLKKPSLDEVFLKYTGARLESGDNLMQVRRMRQAFRRRQ